MFKKLLAGVVFGILALFIFAAISLVAAIPTFFLWNWLLPSIFGIKTVTFLQAWGINFLTSILFKGSSSAIGKS